MPHEHSPKLPLTLDGVAQLAKATTLRDGYHFPTVIAEGDQQNIATLIEQMAPTHEARVQQLFLLGFLLAASGEIGVLQQVFFITEAWMSAIKPGEKYLIQPSKDPQRKEILSISNRVIQPPKTEIVAFEMKRSPQGKLLHLDTLYQSSDPGKTADSPLLEAFVHGFRDNAHHTNN